MLSDRQTNKSLNLTITYFICIHKKKDGRISDVFGRKTALLFATIVFFIGSFLCGAASNLWILVIARAIAGVGGGGINW